MYLDACLRAGILEQEQFTVITTVHMKVCQEGLYEIKPDGSVCIDDIVAGVFRRLREFKDLETVVLHCLLYSDEESFVGPEGETRQLAVLKALTEKISHGRRKVMIELEEHDYIGEEQNCDVW